MKVTVNNNTKKFENKNGVFEQIQDFLNKSLIDSEMFFSHMIIDEVEVYHDYELYIEDRLSKIENILIEVKSYLEFTNDIILSIHDYSDRALPELKQLSDAFYQSSTSSSWSNLDDLVEALQWIYNAIMSIDKEKDTPSNWDKYITIAASFEVLFPNLLEALETQDHILIADIIAYEIIPLFQDINQLDLRRNNKGNYEHVEDKH